MKTTNFLTSLRIHEISHSYLSTTKYILVVGEKGSYNDDKCGLKMWFGSPIFSERFLPETLLFLSITNNQL